MRIFCLFALLISLCRSGAAGEVEVIYEVFSMPLKEAAKLRRERLGGVESYERVLGMVERKEGRQERWMVVKAMLGAAKAATLEEVDELIFPTEYEAPVLICYGDPGLIAGLEAKRDLFPLGQVASAFDTKNMGDTLEVAVGEEEGALMVQMRPTKVSLLQLDKFGKGIGQVEMPRFAVQTLKTEAKVVVGKPALVGTVSPPKDLQKVGEKRVWLAFVTVNEVTK